MSGRVYKTHVIFFYIAGTLNIGLLFFSFYDDRFHLNDLCIVWFRVGQDIDTHTCFEYNNPRCTFNSNPSHKIYYEQVVGIAAIGLSTFFCPYNSSQNNLVTKFLIPCSQYVSRPPNQSSFQHRGVQTFTLTCE